MFDRSTHFYVLGFESNSIRGPVVQEAAIRASKYLGHTIRVDVLEEHRVNNCDGLIASQNHADAEWPADLPVKIINSDQCKDPKIRFDVFYNAIVELYEKSLLIALKQ